MIKLSKDIIMSIQVGSQFDCYPRRYLDIIKINDRIEFTSNYMKKELNKKLKKYLTSNLIDNILTFLPFNKDEDNFVKNIEIKELF